MVDAIEEPLKCAVYGRRDTSPPEAATAAAANRANASSAVQEDSDSEVSVDDEDDDRDEDEARDSGCAAVPEGPTAATRLRDLVASCSAESGEQKRLCSVEQRAGSCDQCHSDVQRHPRQIFQPHSAGAWEFALNNNNNNNIPTEG